MAIVGIVWVLYGLLDGLRQRRRRWPARQPDRVLRLSNLIGTEGIDKGFAATTHLHDPVWCSRLPGRVRHHHRRADLGCHRRPREASALGGVRRHLGHGRLLPRCPLGLRLRRRRVGDRRLDRQQAARHRLRRRYGGAHQRRCWPVSRWRSCSASASAWQREPMRPHNLPLVMLGAGLLWFGWFGFNAAPRCRPTARPPRSRRDHDGRRPQQLAAMLGWLLVERLRDGHATSLGRRIGCRGRPGRHHPGLLRR